MTHNENIIIFFYDIARHLELEDEHLKVAKSSVHAYVAKLGFYKVLSFKRMGNHKFNNKWKDID